MVLVFYNFYYINIDMCVFYYWKCSTKLLSFYIISTGGSLEHTFYVNVQIMYQASDNSYRPLSKNFFNHSRTVTCNDMV